MTLDQRVPTDERRRHGAVVASAFGTRNYFTRRRRLALGGRRQRGRRRSTPSRGQTVTLQRVSGGTQRSLGAFVQDVFTPTDKLVLTLSARVDSWRNYDAHNLETNVPAGTPAAGQPALDPDTEDTVGSPRVRGALPRHRSRDARGATSAGASARRRSTSCIGSSASGAVLTLANDQLGPERLDGGEARRAASRRCATDDSRPRGSTIASRTRCRT